MRTQMRQFRLNFMSPHSNCMCELRAKKVDDL